VYSKIDLVALPLQPFPNFQEQFIMAYGGLRGAVGFSLVMMIDKTIVPSAGIFVTTTLAVVISTVFIQVGNFGPLIFNQVGRSGSSSSSRNSQFMAQQSSSRWGVPGFKLFNQEGNLGTIAIALVFGKFRAQQSSSRGVFRAHGCQPGRESRN